MVIKMSSSQVSRYMEKAKADMIRCNMRQIRCPCQKCKNVRWLDPDSGQLEFHLLRNGFMVGFNHDEGREDEETSLGHGNLVFDDVGGQDNHDDEGDAGGQDHHDDEADTGGHSQGVDSGGENVDT